MQKHFAKGSAERQQLADAVAALKQKSPIEVPLVVGGQHVSVPMFGF
jgi:1-pyrroline-5-carboxylate dehydrogenase